MKNCKKTRASKFDTKPSLFSGESLVLRNLFLRNKPNFNHSNITATSYITVVYNTYKTKPKNGANPNKPNLKPISSTTKPSLFPGEPANSSTLICKNKPNYEHLDVNITVCKKKGYKGFSLKIYQKNKPKTNPIQSQSKPIPKPHFSAELFSDTRLRQGPPAGVLVYVDACKKYSKDKRTFFTNHFIKGFNDLVNVFWGFYDFLAKKRFNLRIDLRRAGR